MAKRKPVTFVSLSVDIERPIFEMLDYVAARDRVDVVDVVKVALVDALIRLAKDDTVLGFVRYLRDDVKCKRSVINNGIVIE